MFGSSQWMYSSGTPSFYDHQIDGSLRFDRGDNSYLRRTMSSGNQRTWTFSAWVKRCDLTNSGLLFESRPPLADNDRTFIAFTSGQNITITDISGGGHVWRLDTLAVFRDPSAWYHIVVKFDTTQATSSNRVKLYVNGVLFDDYNSGVAGAGYPSQNYQADISAALPHTICDSATVYSANLSNYVAEVHFTDGTAYDADAFGEFKSGVWVPKEPSVTYGTNGFYLEFAGNANDSSGNGNNFTANNISSYDYVPDSPTNNFATWNPLGHWNWLSQNGSKVYSQGNLQFSCDNYGSMTGATIAFSSGKWYMEYRMTSGDQYDFTGLLSTRTNPTGNRTYAWYSDKIFKNDPITNAETELVTGLTPATSGEIIGVAVDLDNYTIKWYKDNSLVTTVSNIDPDTYTFVAGGAAATTQVANFGQDSSFLGNETAQGNSDANGYGDFHYAPPSGYLALCTANLTVADAVDPLEDNSPQDYFNTVLYTGDSSTQSITGVGFQPDWTYIYERNTTSTPIMVDVLRGTTKILYSNSSDGERTSSDAFQSFDSDGFTVKYGNSGDYYINRSGQAYVAWNWKANGSGVSNTDGSITSTVSANTDAGFSIVSYTGTGSVGTVGHGLNSAPEFFMCKNRQDDNENWTGYSAPTGNTKKIEFNTANGAQTTSNWNNTSPTSSVFTLGANDNSNKNGNAHIAYCFHSVEGFSKFGSYTGNGSSDGAFIYTGFRPAFMMVKRTDSSGGWLVFDNERVGYNPDNNHLLWNSNGSEYTDLDSDIVSNGFKFRSGGGDHNGSGASYIYMAFAENPFKYANAR